jgi:hypothetical protein
MAKGPGLFKKSFNLKQDIMKTGQIPERLNFNIFDSNIYFEIMLTNIAENSYVPF